jgi:hypothetical protein
MTTVKTTCAAYHVDVIHNEVVKRVDHALLNVYANAIDGDADLVVVAVPAGDGQAFAEVFGEHLARSVEHKPGCEHASGDATDEHQLAAPTTTPEEGTR